MKKFGAKFIFHLSNSDGNSPVALDAIMQGQHADCLQDFSIF